MFYLEEGKPIFDKESDILVGNGLTLSFLFGSKYHDNYIFDSFSFIFNKVKEDTLFIECLKKVLPQKYKNFIQDYNEDFINKSFKSYSSYCFFQLLEKDELSKESFEKYLKYDHLFLTDYYISDLNYRMMTNTSDFESWFLFTDLIILTLQQRAIIAKARYEFMSNKKYKEDKEYKKSLAIFQDLFDIEKFIKSVLIFWLFNYDKEKDKLISIELNPILDKNKINFKNKLLLSNRIITLNYDSFLEKILEIENIHHIHGRLNKIYINDEIINISSKNLPIYFNQILENVLLSSFPLAKRAERNSKLLRPSSELESLIGVSNVDRSYFKKINEILEKNSDWNDPINFLKTEKIVYRCSNNKRLIIMGVRPKSDMSYIIDMIRNYDEIYISYYNEQDRISLSELVNWLNDILEERKHERKNWELVHLRNKSRDGFKIKIFNIYEISKIGINNFEERKKEIEAANIQSQIMKSVMSHTWNQPTTNEVIEILKKFKIIIEDIKKNFKQKYGSSMGHGVDNEYTKLIEEFVMKNKSTETLYCYYQFKLAAENYNKYFFNGLLDTINQYLSFL